SKISLPVRLLKVKKELIKPFIQAYFDCDASVNKKNRKIEFTTASSTMCFQVQNLLLRFGIISLAKEKKVKGKIYYRIVIRGDNVNKYKKSIGFTHPFKSKRLNSILQKKCVDHNYDIVPNMEGLLFSLIKKLRIKIPRHLRYSLCIRPDVHRKKLRLFVNIIKKRQDEILKLKGYVKKLNDLRLSIIAAKKLAKELGPILNRLFIDYSDLSKYSGLSNKCVKKYLEGNIGNLKTAKKIYKTALFLVNCRLSKVNGSIESFLPKNCLLNCAYFSREVVIPGTTFECHFYRTPRLTKNIEAIETVLKEFSRKWNENIELIQKKLPQLRMLLDAIDDEIPVKEIKIVTKNLGIELKEIYSSKKIRARGLGYFDEYNSKLQTLLKFIDYIMLVWNEMNSERLKESVKKLEVLANSDIFWDKVKSVRKVKAKEKYVYDLTVEPNHIFIANGMIVHNTSLLSSLLLEIMRKFRLIIQEDTLELPVSHLRQLGYNIERLKSRSVITRVETEVPADEALRTALRLGDSCLIVGEVRSVESTVLFEAMRIGALANVVAGTIHGESPYGVYDRVVHDLGVAPTSFKAIDLITICNMLRSPDGLHRFRRVVELTEVRKHWKQDPLDEGGFVPLMQYSAKEDRLKPTDTLIEGESYVLNEIAKRVREWHGRWDDVWDNILLRAKVKQSLVDYAEKLNRPEILEADFVCDANEMFHLISEQVRQEVGALDSKMIYEKWIEWLKSRLK
ncbi:MAG: ATPase, T2SS/T4P/T4SS family, partial [Candidatus Aenigmarchaeota archaeon]|nr:ATPase, T2SS/T4P/T4SS family [Candidatus Aenigmarchaeota archaeon]